jgi:hypothetical protein
MSERKDYDLIIDHWNSKNIIRVREVNRKLKDQLARKFQTYSVLEVKKAIDNYATILKSDKHWYSVRWALQDFLNRALDRFLDADVKKDYIKDRGKDEQSKSGSEKPEFDNPDWI